MPRNRRDTGSPHEWMRYAEADLALARAPLPEGAFYEQLCFHAQQAVEKSLKALLVRSNIDFPFTHDLQLLVDLLPAGIPTTPALVVAARLTPFSVGGRYPGEEEPVSEEEYREVLGCAEEIVTWAGRQIRRIET